MTEEENEVLTDDEGYDDENEYEEFDAEEAEEVIAEEETENEENGGSIDYWGEPFKW